MTAQQPTGETGTRPARDNWMAMSLVVAFGAVLFSVIAVAFSLRSDSEDGSGTVAATGEPVSFDVELGEMYVEPAVIEVPAGSPVTLNVTNVGDMPHDLAVNGTDGTRMLEAGESEEITIGPFDADAEAWCTVAGHREAGMDMDIVVTGGEPAAETASAEEATTEPEATGAEIDFDAEPGDGWQPYDPELAPAPGGTEHDITLRATEVDIEVAPGVTQEMWTFEDMVPGPILRGSVGDIFTVTLVNEGDIGHSIDFHASKVAWDDEMRTIGPGEELVYQFEAKHAGMFMYHCGTPPALHHIGNGMFGAIIIDPPELAEVDHEFAFVQSELYTGPEGEPGDLTKMMDDRWDAVVFNNYVNQYLHAPIEVETGDRVRAWVLSAGPNENSSFHIVGTVFDTVYKEGTYLLTPDERQGGAQALDLQPSQGGFVEFTFDADGLYPIVTHKFSNASRGALGLFASGEVDAEDAGGH